MKPEPFSKEYELRASARRVFESISTEQGLTDWFAEKVKLEERNVFGFFWDTQAYHVKQVLFKNNKYVKYRLYEGAYGTGASNAGDLEFFINTNDLTLGTFLKIIDSTGGDDPDDLEEFWDDKVGSLRHIIGG